MGADLKKPSAKWRVGDWVACSETDTIACGLQRHKLERRAMEALVVLAERGGEVVKKDELIAAVWGRIAVSDHSVAMVISQLRRALSDDARAPRYIETITKRGYRLIVPCEPVNATAISLEGERIENRKEKRERSSSIFSFLLSIFSGAYGARADR